MFRKKKISAAVINEQLENEQDEDFLPVKKRFRFPFGKKTDDNDMFIEQGSTTLLDILSPSAIDITGREYIEVDGVYHAYLYITGYGYSTVVGNGWLSSLVEAGEGIGLNFIIKRQQREKILSKIAQTTMVNRSRMRDVGDTRQDYEELDSAISAGLYLKDNMNRNSEDFYYMHTLIEVTADDAETLEYRVSSVETLCVSVDLLAKRCDYRHEQGFLSSLPLLYLDPDIERKSRRNALTTGVAASFPFASFELCDKRGIFIGKNMHNNSACMIDLFDRFKYNNGNIAWFGATGAGKTYGIQCVAGRLRQQNKRVFIIAPSKGYEYRSACEAYGGVYVKWAPSSEDSYNYMEIRRRTLDADSEARGISSNDSLLANHISKLTSSFALLKRNLTDEDKNYLDASLVECYRGFGITFDNRTLFDESGQYRDFPTPVDWYDTLHSKEETKHLAIPLLRFVTGSAASMVRKSNIPRDAKYYVFNVSEVPDELREFVTFWSTQFCSDMAQESILTEDVLIIDESWILVGATSTPEIAGRVLELAKTIRGYNGILITASQDLADFLSLDDGRYGKGIINACRIKIIMQLEEIEAQLVKGILNLSDNEVTQITRNRRGEALLSIGNSRISLSIHSSAREYAAITTAAADITASRDRK
jgi:DNA replication protein DnaC